MQDKHKTDGTGTHPATAPAQSGNETRPSAELHHSILQTAMDGFWIVDAQGHLLEVNEAYCRMSGYSASELLTMSIPDLEASLTEAEITCRIRDIMAKGGERFTSRHRRKDGSVFDIEVSAQYLPLESGRIVNFLRDITESKRADAARFETLARFSGFSEASQYGMGMADLDGRIIYANRTLARMLGEASPDVCLGKHFPSAYYSREMSVRLEEEVLPALMQEGHWQGELELIAMDGRRIPTEENYFVIRDEHGRPRYLADILTDITDRKRAEEERVKLQTQLSQAQKMESIGRLAGGVAHDFNNMLGVILGYAELALKELNPDQPLFTRIMEIRKAAERSADLTRQLLAFARKQTVTPRIIGLNETVEEMLKMLRRIIGEHIDLVWLPGRNPGPVKMDPSQIDQILANLCVNARDAIGNRVSGKVIIETGACAFDEACYAGRDGFIPGEYARLSVSDNGCGMGPEMLSHLFEPFYTTKDLGKGTGLGLATVYGIVGQNNGFIDVRSEPGTGTTFSIYLPRAIAAVPEIKAVAAISIEGGHETILVVEDEPALLELTSAMLGSLGYTVLGASTPEAAIRLARENSHGISLLITDVIMPVLNGQDLAQKIMSVCPCLKCLFMSGYTADVMTHRGADRPDLHFLQKPFSLEALALKVRETLNSRSG